MTTPTARIGGLALLALLFVGGPLFSGPLFSGALFAGSDSRSPTGRRTTDREADLIAALIEVGETEAAAEICQRHLATNPPGSAAGAAWSIRLSMVRVATLQAAGNDDDAAWAAARQPLARALQGYEAEPHAPWIEFQNLLVSLARSDQRTMRFLANPADTAARDALLEDLRTTIDGLRALDTRLSERIPLADAGRLDAAAADDLMHLQQSVRRRTVQALLLRADAYPPGSDDALAAATEAEEIAERLLGSVASDAGSREAAVRVWAETRRRAENPQAAIELLTEWLEESGSVEPETLAQLVLAELNAGDRQAAADLLQKFYGGDPATAPESAAMDLARLRYLIGGEAGTAEDRARIASWIDQIERRSGAYARRRAETEMLRVVRVRPSEGNATLMAARAGQLLREGGDDAMLQAAQLLGEASVAAGESVDGFRWGLQSAAAFTKLQRHAQASRMFAQTATRWPEQPQASLVHFEAARQWSKHIAASSADAPRADPAAQAALIEGLEQLLVDQLERWPTSPEAVQARTWLLKIYEASHRYEQAARIVLRLSPDSVDWLEAIGHAGQLWRRALAAVEPAETRREIARRGLDAWKTVPPKHAAAAVREANLIAALAFDRDLLRSAWQELPAVDAAGGIAHDLRRVRLEGVDPQTVAMPTAELPDQRTVIELGLWRLREDAKQHPADRDRMARAMLRLVEGSGVAELADHPLVADALALSGRWQEAADRWERIAAASPPQPEILRRGALLLGTLEDPAAGRRAIEFWNRLSQGYPQGTPSWHEAKLATATLLKNLGEDEEAAKLARYVLLTKPPDDPALKAKYQQLAR